MVELETAATAAEYRAFICELPHAHVTQSCDWPKVKQNWDSQRFISRNEAGQIRAGAQLLHLQDAKTGRGFAYIPRGPVGDKAAAPELIEAALTWCEQNQIGLMRIDPDWEDNTENRELLERLANAAANHPGCAASIRRLPEHTLGQPPIEMIGTLPGADFDAWLEAMPSRYRRKIRQAINDDTVTSISTDRASVENLHRLLVATAQRQGISYRPKNYFYDLFDAFDDVYFAIGRVDGQVVSASMSIVFKDTAYWLYAGNDLEAALVRSPLATTVEAFAEASRRGLKHVNLGGAFAVEAEQCSLAHFKRQLTGAAGTRVFVGEIDFNFTPAAGA